MTTGDLVTGDWTAEFRGLALGDGSPYELGAIEGLRNTTNEGNPGLAEV